MVVNQIKAFGNEIITRENYAQVVNGIFDPLELARKMEDYALTAAGEALDDQARLFVMEDFKIVRTLLIALKQMERGEDKATNELNFENLRSELVAPLTIARKLEEHALTIARQEHKTGGDIFEVMENFRYARQVLLTIKEC